MLAKLMQDAKGNRREYIATLMKNVTERTPAVSGLEVTRANRGKGLNIKVTKSQTDLSRFQSLSYSNRYLYMKESGDMIELDQISEDVSSSLLAKTTSRSGDCQIRFRKGEKNDKDVFIEVWTSSSSQALRSTLKVTDKMSKIYNDVVFGGIAWSEDEKRICFVGEKPEPANYKSFWDAKKPDEEEEKKGEDAAAAGDKKKEEEKKEEHYQDEKFLLNRDFGEMLVDKKNPAIFVFDAVKNTLNQV